MHNQAKKVNKNETSPKPFKINLDKWLKSILEKPRIDN